VIALTLIQSTSCCLYLNAFSPATIVLRDIPCKVMTTFRRENFIPAIRLPPLPATIHNHMVRSRRRIGRPAAALPHSQVPFTRYFHVVNKIQPPSITFHSRMSFFRNKHRI
jgi:hypothetical protein